MTWPGRPTTAAMRCRARAPAPPGPSWNTEPLEQVLLDLMSLGQRFNWGQLEVFTRSDPGCRRPAAGRLPGSQGRRAGAGALRRLVLSGQPGAVAGYVLKFSETGLADLGSALQIWGGRREGTAGAQPALVQTRLRHQLAALAPLGALLGAASDYCWLMPWFAMGVKWFLYLAAAFCWPRRCILAGLGLAA